MKTINMMLAMVVGAGLLFGAQMVLQEVNARVSPEDTTLEPWDECTAISFDFTCFNILEDQNKEIIELLKWQNCILKHKEARDYQPPNQDRGWNAQNFIQLEGHCGDMPT